jgi:hypothetical protein
MKKINTINICESKYKIYLHTDFDKLQKLNKINTERYYPEKELDKDKKIDGFCDYSSKEIHVFKDKYQSKDYTKMVIRHEITHAYLYEIGYTYCSDEEFVDKVCKWAPTLMGLTETIYKDLSKGDKK